MVTVSESGPGSVLPADPYAKDCPSRQVIDLIGDKWTVLIVGALEEEPMRFSEIKRRIEGISQKMLAHTLRRLERDGLITRHAYAEVPVRVEYALTDNGRSLQTPLKALEDWATGHLPDVMTARDRYESGSLA